MKLSTIVTIGSIGALGFGVYSCKRDIPITNHDIREAYNIERYLSTWPTFKYKPNDEFLSSSYKEVYFNKLKIELDSLKTLPNIRHGLELYKKQKSDKLNYTLFGIIMGIFGLNLGGIIAGFEGDRIMNSEAYKRSSQLSRE